MAVILILLLASLGVALLFLGGFIWAVRSGQFEDTLTPSMRILTEETSAASGRAPAAPAPAEHELPEGRKAAEEKEPNDSHH